MAFQRVCDVYGTVKDVRQTTVLVIEGVSKKQIKELCDREFPGCEGRSRRISPEQATMNQQRPDLVGVSAWVIDADLGARGLGRLGNAIRGALAPVPSMRPKTGDDGTATTEPEA